MEKILDEVYTHDGSPRKVHLLIEPNSRGHVKFWCRYFENEELLEEKDFPKMSRYEVVEAARNWIAELAE